MARSISEIYNQMMIEKASVPSLNGLQPASDTFVNLINQLNSRAKVAVWRLIFYIIAVAIHTHEVFLELLLKRLKPGTIPWYREKCLEFELGSPLVYQNGIYGYNPVNENNRIITHAAVIEKSNSILLIKVAKGIKPNLLPLSHSEKTAFQAYLHLIKFAGTIIELISEPADTVKVSYRIFYDPILLNPDSSLISNPSVYPVQDTINLFLSSLDFGGMLYLEQLDTAIQNTIGVKNIVRLSAYAKYGSLPYSDIQATPNHAYEPFSGYCKISSNPGETLNDTLIFIPYVA